jgi:hypothetical protein
MLLGLLAALVLPMLMACGAPNTGARDVISPAEHRRHEMQKDKHEGG